MSKIPDQTQGLAMPQTSKWLHELNQFQISVQLTENLHLQVLLAPGRQNLRALEYNWIIITELTFGPTAYETAVFTNKREKQILETHFSENTMTILCCDTTVQRHQPTAWESGRQQQLLSHWKRRSIYFTVFDRLCKHPSEVSVRFRAAGVPSQWQFY